MTRGFLVFVLLICCCLFSSCLMTYGYNISRKYTTIKSDSCVKINESTPVTLFFEGEPIKFDYEKIGIVEITGSQNAMTEDLLNHLKYEAFKNGANAVIAVKDVYETRKAGIVFSKTPPAEYSAHVYSGISVKLKNTAAISSHQDKDTTFINKVKQYDYKFATKSKNEIVGSFFVVLLLLGVLIYAVAIK